MKMKMMLIIALTAISLLLVTTTIRQAQAGNIQFSVVVDLIAQHIGAGDAIQTEIPDDL